MSSLRGSMSTGQTSYTQVRTKIEQWNNSRPDSSDVYALRRSYTEVMAEIPTAASVSFTTEVVAGVPVERAVPREATKTLVLYLHGGGYVIGSARTHRGLVSAIAEQVPAEVIAVDYRLAPEHCFPAAVDDVLATYHALLDAGYDPRTTVWAGDSAGGGLGVGAALAARDCGSPLPAALIALSPVADLPHEGRSMKDNADQDPVIRPQSSIACSMLYVGDRLENLRHPYASPVYADLTGLPPLLIQVGSAEVLYDDSARLHEAAVHSGVHSTLRVWPDGLHSFQAFGPWTPEGSQSIEEIAEVIRTHSVGLT